MAISRKIDFYYSRDKLSALDGILNDYKCSLLETVYVGDDIFDTPILSRVGFSFCPSDAPEDVKASCTHVLKSSGGRSVVAELYDTLVKTGLIVRSMLGMK